ncbi:MAG: hypothetical protein H7039_15880 [Bryobacteraceae bacterium]|nr:hypothetical protein [Bryobacteraceae bacterium]
MNLRTLLPMFALTLTTGWAQALYPEIENKLQRYEETADKSVLDGAKLGIEQLAAADRNSTKGRLLLSRVALAESRFADALKLAQAVNREVPDELDAYGLIVDAARGLGKTKEAEEAADWMIRLRPEDPRGLWRVALLRQDFKDYAGAEQVLNDSYARVPRTELTMRARMMTEMARIYGKTGRDAEAKRFLEQAVKLVPNYHPAIVLMRRTEEK